MYPARKGQTTAAAIIASQAIVAGSFSMTRQAMLLGWLPGIEILQTSDKVYGQFAASPNRLRFRARSLPPVIADPYETSDRPHRFIGGPNSY